MASAGFTLIELLVVISIIVILLSLFATGMRKVKIIAANLRQKSKFHAMEVGLEFFEKDFSVSFTLPKHVEAAFHHPGCQLLVAFS